MGKLHRDFEPLLEEEAVMQHLRPRDPVIRLHQVVETEENVGEVFTMGQVPPAERLDVDRPKAFQHTFSRSGILPPPADPCVKMFCTVPLPPSSVR